MAVIDDDESTVNDVAVMPPNSTTETWLKPVPLMVTLVPPSVLPVWFDRLVICGATRTQADFDQAGVA